MSEHSEQLTRRLVGAGAVFGAAFVLALLLPQPDPSRATDEGQVVLQLSQPQASDEVSPDIRQAGAPSRVTTERAPRETQLTGRDEAGGVSSAAPEPKPEPAPAPSSASRASPAPQPADATRAGEGDWWIQAAAYSDSEAAERGLERIAVDFSVSSRLRDVTVDGNRYWRLQVGPLPREAAANELATRLRDAGFQGARVFDDGAR